MSETEKLDPAYVAGFEEAKERAAALLEEIARVGLPERRYARIRTATAIRSMTPREPHERPAVEVAA